MPLVAAALLGAVSYLMALGTMYSWWVVVLVSPLALAGAMLAAAFLWPSPHSRVLRALFVLLGAGWVYVGLTQPDRLGSVLMGIAFIMIGALPPRPEPSIDSVQTPEH